MDKKEWISPLIFGVLMMCLIVFGTVIWISMELEEGRMDNFCHINYPSSINDSSLHMSDFSNTKRIEPGYVECCRYYYSDNHTRETECIILPYDD